MQGEDEEQREANKKRESESKGGREKEMNIRGLRGVCLVQGGVC